MDAEPRDEVYRESRDRLDDFKFDGRVAAVFDDMVTRSVPFYTEIQRMVTEMTADFAAPGTSVYDLGCSTGTTLLELDPAVDRSVRFIGIDNADEMLSKCRKKFLERGVTRPYELRRLDLNEGAVVENASVVLLILTLQFVRPLYRERLVADIYEGLNQNGCLIVVEKVLGEDSLFNRLFIKHYYEMKRRNGYTETEITQKREALENVLIPYRLEENRELLLRSGFRSVDVFFKWYNFCAMIALK
ncbi:MAG: carboxy-S-adenosyl-L-methionine synthase CmoA [Povalibacter sp.]